MSNAQVVSYYHHSQWLYELLCYNEKSLGMHYGVWEKTTKNRHEAMLNQNQIILDRGNITKKDRVLDAGCGVGGTAIYIAKKTGAHVVGISITPVHIERAKKYAKKHGVENLTEFFVQDYTKTTFPDESFDVIFGNESVCYSTPKLKFLKEAYRLLKPGGRLVILDGYLARPTKTPQEKKIIDEFKYGYALDEFITPPEMSEQIVKAGFIDLHEESLMAKVAPSVKEFERMCVLLSPLAQIARFMPSKFLYAGYMNYLSLWNTAKAHKIGLCTHNAHWAKKPKK